MVAGEVGGIDLESSDGASIAELDNAPIVGGIVAASLPAIVPGTGGDEATRGRDRGGGGEEVLGLGEPFVGKGEDFASTGGDSKIYFKLNMGVGCESVRDNSGKRLLDLDDGVVGEKYSLADVLLESLVDLLGRDNSVGGGVEDGHCGK